MISPWQNIFKNSSEFKFLFVGSVGVVQQENTKGREFFPGYKTEKRCHYMLKVAKWYQSIYNMMQNQ